MMYKAPGIYFEQVDRTRTAIGSLRTDVVGFLGYAQRGPLLVPVKINSWRQFTAVFGDPLNFAYLAYAVRGFFDNGGASCHIVRVADPDIATAATVFLPDANGDPALRLWASHGTLHDPVTGDMHIENGQPIRYESPGSWANNLSVTVQPASLGHTETSGIQPEDGRSSYVGSLSGFEMGSIVRLSQGEIDLPRYQRIAEINPHLRQLVWGTPINNLGFDLADPIQFETVEFTLLIHQDGQIIERHLNLSLSSKHSRHVVTTLRANSNLVDIDMLLHTETGEWADPDKWPTDVDRMPLSGGHDGLSTVAKGNFLNGLDQLVLVDEVSLLAAPDLVLRAEATPSRSRSHRPSDPCQVLENLPTGKVFGAVLERMTINDDLQNKLDALVETCGPLDSGSEQGIPLTGVEVSVLESDTTPVISDKCGRFIFKNLPLGQVTLLFHREGYHDLERTAQSYTVLPSEPVRSYMTPVTLPPALSLDDIFEVQEAMLLQGRRGFYRVALLDPPPETLGIDEIQTWRARFDSAFAVLYYPWLTVSALDNSSTSGSVCNVPPSGHIAGLIANTDITQGVHRAPANLVLEGVKALTRVLNDKEQGTLNPQGINCMRVQSGRGIRVYGARTLSSDSEWLYLNVRRLVLMIEEAIEDASQWAVFEPNNMILRQALTYSLNGFLNVLWQQGALAGTTPEAAFTVKCDDENNPPSVVDAGQLIAEIGVAPTIPFEFIHFKLGRTIEAVEVTE